MHWPLRPPPRAPSRPVPVPAGIALMIDGEGFADMPLGGYQGSTLPTSPPVVSVPGPPLRIDPPPWAGQEGDINIARSRDEAEPDTSRTISAVDAMMADDAEWPELPGPPLVYEPLRQPVFPEPDWRQEEVERGLRTSGETQAELESHEAPSSPTYPAAKT